MMCFETCSGPLGELTLIASDEGLHAAVWNLTGRELKAQFGSDVTRNAEHRVLARAKKQFGEYFAGRRKSFDLPLAPRGTEFQRRAWEALTRIPYGETRSYQQQAESLGGARFARAVGAANGANPISIAIPCHRVVGKSGKLTGFLYGVKAKALLLGLEQGQK